MRRAGGTPSELRRCALEGSAAHCKEAEHGQRAHAARPNAFAPTTAMRRAGVASMRCGMAWLRACAMSFVASPLPNLLARRLRLTHSAAGSRVPTAVVARRLLRRLGLASAIWVDSLWAQGGGKVGQERRKSSGETARPSTNRPGATSAEPSDAASPLPGGHPRRRTRRAYVATVRRARRVRARQ